VLIRRCLDLTCGVRLPVRVDGEGWICGAHGIRVCGEVARGSGDVGVRAVEDGAGLRGNMLPLACGMPWKSGAELSAIC
jgi:hypothetical protein